MRVRRHRQIPFFGALLFAINLFAHELVAQTKPENTAWTFPEALSAIKSLSPRYKGHRANDVEPVKTSSGRAGLVSISTFAPVSNSVNVHAPNGESIMPSRAAYRGEIQSAAGSYGDYSRYLLMMPGVVGASNADTMNDILVRGGHPSENLYIVDGLEIPYINHFQVEGSTSGFTPMLNTSSIEKVELKPDIYDAEYSSRLSSLIEIESREAGESPRSGEVNLGISGLGAFWQAPLDKHADIFFAFDRSLFNLVTNDLGLNGVPVYTNGTARLRWKPNAKDQLSLLSLDGGDSISIAPCAGDLFETLTIDMQYGGLHTNTGLIWQHTYSPSTVSKLILSYAAQSLNIGQQEQIVDGVYQSAIPSGNNCTPMGTTPVYAGNTTDRLTTLGYNVRHQTHGWVISAGSTVQMVGLNYTVAQPNGIQSPFNPDPTWTDADSFHRKPTSVQTGSYADATGPLGKRLTASAGLRAETFGLTRTHTWNPYAGLGLRIDSHQAIRATYRRSAQLPPYIDILSYPQNRSLKPIRVEQLSVGADLWRMNSATLSVEAYRKRYFDEPASSEYPSLTLANMVYTPGDQIFWLPLVSSGRGKASGLELSLRGHWRERVSALAAVTYSRVQYMGLDGILRAGNYDVPLVGNGLITFHLPKAWNLSLRDSYMTGRPYTPFNTALSVQQERGIYDLSKVNAVRGSAYNRADISVDHDFRLHDRVLNLYGGLQNVFDRKNFLGYVWLSQCNQVAFCLEGSNNVPMVEIYQMPAFPVAGIRWKF